ncbi:MAG: hypothetical protein CMM48_11370 [Rhodospirillaceae bacterium]|nr:hypothetical protein [Rhodospirillaceae bacterium]
MLLAAGCGVLEGGAGEAEICPVPSILETLQELVRFKPGAGYDLSQALFHVKLNAFEGECDIGKKEITLTVAIDMTALRGAAMQKSRAEFAFWVWIMDRDKKLLTRHRFPIITKFEGRDSRIDFTDFFDVIIPQRADHAPPDWRIFIGLELTKEELAYNRRRLGSKGRR